MGQGGGRTSPTLTDPLISGWVESQTGALTTGTDAEGQIQVSGGRSGAASNTNPARAHDQERTTG